MAQTTSRLGLYLPGGGSTGTNTPDEAADIDKINDNMSKIDAAAGATICTSGTRPSSPYNGRLIFETDTRQVRVWNSGTSTWDLVGGTTYPAANLTGSVAIANGGTNASTASDARINLSTGYRTKHVAIYDTGSYQQLTTAYDYLTGVGFTYAQRGLPIRLTVNITFYNLTSGLARWGSYRILKDGTTVIGNAQIQVPVTYITTNDRCSATYVVTTTTAASGNASFNVQALASANSAVGVTFCHFQLEELEGTL